jgi:tRNA dimethylallyltransferase
MQNRIIFIVGPTGVGKSAVALALAPHVNGAIVSADAMQVYTEVNIACDKPSVAERQRIPHFMFDVASVQEEYNVAQYGRAARAAIRDILAQKKTPIVVGGSGMYVNVLLDGIFDATYKDDMLSQTLFKKAEEQGSMVLHQELMVKDPQAAHKIHPHDTKRIVRALEVFSVSGKPISELQQKREGLWGTHDISIYGLTMERALLYKKVEDRIDQMFAKGLVQEVEEVAQLPLSRTAATLIGIPEVQGYVKGQYDIDRAKYLMKRNTRHYVKRQLTWFRRDPRIVWIDVENLSMEIILQKVL